MWLKEYRVIGRQSATLMTAKDLRAGPDKHG
ncbi:hypothetical protein PSYRMG_07555 [Pseudomonas syringae UMAF0158]|nr:hypothetical protein PSYRMG_07555 [Pseudomonas syringae UMAF0158]